MEEWKQIKGFEAYEISSFGNVRSRRGIQKQRLCTTGRPQASLYKDGKQYQIFNHRLVAEAFIPNPNNKPQIDHIDRNRTNNHISNLRWVSASTNQQNTIKKKHNTSGFKNVFKYEYVGKKVHTIKWFSSFSFNFKKYTSEFFNTTDEAHQWYITHLALLTDQGQDNRLHGDA
jgi:hypothetical protein